MDSYSPFQTQTLVEFVDPEDITNEKFRTLDLTSEVNNVTSKLESQNLCAGTYDSNPLINLTQTTDPNNKSKPQLRNCCNHCRHHSVSNCFRKQQDDEERKRKSFFRSKAPVITLIHHLKSYQNQIHIFEKQSS